MNERKTEPRVELIDQSPPPADLAAEVAAGLRQQPPQLPCKLFYDASGCALFERITATPEYYPTRVELGILRRAAGSIAAFLGPGALLVEYGSGSGQKTRLLLDRLVEPAGYVPIDIARDELLRAARALARDYPGLRVMPIAADYARSVDLSRLPVARDNVAVFFPGSTIGNFDPEHALAFLTRARAVGGKLVIGVDLVKEQAVLDAAYDDAAGVTAEFNKNALLHVNRALGADFDIGAWRHVAFFDPIAARVEMHLESLSDQTVRFGGLTFRFAAGERIHTEHSYKWTIDGFAALAARAGWRTSAVHTDEQAWFAEFCCDADPALP